MITVELGDKDKLNVTNEVFNYIVKNGAKAYPLLVSTEPTYDPKHAKSVYLITGGRVREGEGENRIFSCDAIPLSVASERPLTYVEVHKSCGWHLYKDVVNLRNSL